ncbi:hypothetical protein GC163_06545 [bacterium]|nr:hypothetical protein [bacterium]
MNTLPLDLPVIQNWSCHNCGGCCTQHLIEITEEERQRIEQQKWTADDGVTQPPVVSLTRWPRKPRWRLAHRDDGGCVFLNEQGLCRIHAKFGEAAKPLACRVYPYALHPHGKSVAVSLRFSCPSVIRNAGKPVSEQRSDIKTIAELIVPDHANRMAAPAVTNQDRLDWPEFERLIEPLTGLLTDTHIPLLVRIFRSLGWVSLLQQSRVSQLTKPQLKEYLGLITRAVKIQFEELPSPIDPPGKVGRLYFRLFAAQYARKDTVQSLSAGWRGRWKLLRAILAFSKGRGNVPALQSGLNPVPFAELESSLGGIPEGTSELFTRYWQVKMEGIHFCGPAYYGFSFVDGFHSLMLVLPVTLWVARWRAKSQERTAITLEDVQSALAIVDHNHGFSEALGQRDALRRIRYLAESGELARLCVWYAQ